MGRSIHNWVICWLALGGACGTAAPSVEVSESSALVREEADALVRTDDGFIRGSSADDHRGFFGIPYAAPPIGPLRWRSPQPVRPWRGIRDATAPGARCAQLDYADSQLSLAEDCLYLDVITPARLRGRARPVMVWIHGGGFQHGSSAEFDLSRLANLGEVVVVSINYRLGPLGFFGHPGLVGSGTFGLQDQQAALRWVQRNIGAFSGDPRQVTIFGTSAGGSSVCAQLASPGAAGLFHRAVIQSMQCSTRNAPEQYIYLSEDPAYQAWKPREQVEATGSVVAQKLGCTDPDTALACLRGVPVESLLRATGADDTWIYWTPAYVTALLPLHPGQAIAEGRIHDVPVLAGTTRDEGSVFVRDYDWLTPEIYTPGLRQMFGDAADAVSGAYRLADYVSPRHAWSAVITDAGFVCPALEADLALARRAPVYVYELADREAPIFFEWSIEVPTGAYHGSDIVQLFDVPSAELVRTPEQQRLSEQVIRYWTQFARTGDPNAHDLPTWRPFEEGYVQSLAPGAIGPVDLFAEHNCDLWSSMGSSKAAAPGVPPAGRARTL